MGRASRKKRERGSAPDYILKHTTKGLIASMEEVVIQAKDLAALGEREEEPRGFGLFVEKCYTSAKIRHLENWMTNQDISLAVLALSRDPCKIMQDGLKSLALTKLQAFPKILGYKR